MLAIMPPDNWVINPADELGDVRFMVVPQTAATMIAQGNCIKERVTGALSLPDPNLPANAAPFSAPDWCGNCIDNSSPVFGNRAKMLFGPLSQWPSIFSSVPGPANGYPGPLTWWYIAQELPGISTLRHADGQGTMTPSYGYYQNCLSVNGRVGMTLRDGAGNVLLPALNLFQLDTVAPPYMLLIAQFGGPGHSAGCKVFSNIDAAGHYTSTVAQVASFPTVDAAHSLYVSNSNAGAIATGINANGGWGSSTGGGAYERFVTYGAVDRALPLDQMQRVLNNPWHMLCAP